MSEKQSDFYTQRLYPTVNNDDLLEFRIPPNKRGHLDLSNVLLHFIVKIPDNSDNACKVRGQNYLGAKQFSSLEVRVNGEAVSRRSCANEYFLSAFFQYTSNYAIDYQMSALRQIGLFDSKHLTTAELVAMSTSQKNSHEYTHTNPAGGNEYEIIMPVDANIFSSNGLLPSNTAIDLSFERTSAKLCSLQNIVKAQTDSKIELKDAYLDIPFKQCPELFQLERNAISKPIKIQYDDYVIKRFNIPKGSNSVMLNNLLNGQLPSTLFWGIQKMDSYNGSFNSSSTKFSRYKTTKADLYLDGKEVDGYPVTFSAAHVSQPYVKFLKNTNQNMNGCLSRMLDFIEYEKYSFIHTKSFEQSESGSLSFEFDFDANVTDDLVLITCSVYNRTMKLDHNRNFQII